MSKYIGKKVSIKIQQDDQFLELSKDQKDLITFNCSEGATVDTDQLNNMINKLNAFFQESFQ